MFCCSRLGTKKRHRKKYNLAHWQGLLTNQSSAKSVPPWVVSHTLQCHPHLGFISDIFPLILQEPDEMGIMVISPNKQMSRMRLSHLSGIR